MVNGLEAPSGTAVLGFRAEDAEIGDPASSGIVAPVYTKELLGDAAMITVRFGDALVAVKAHKEFRIGIGEQASIRVPAEIRHLFDRQTGAPLDGGTPPRFRQSRE